jgi:hypothetical protein
MRAALCFQRYFATPLRRYYDFAAPLTLPPMRHYDDYEYCRSLLMRSRCDYAQLSRHAAFAMPSAADALPLFDFILPPHFSPFFDDAIFFIIDFQRPPWLMHAAAFQRR